MSKVSDIWLPRIGPKSTAMLERSMFYLRSGLVGGLSLDPVFWFFNVRRSDLGMGLTFISMVLWMIFFFSRSGYLQNQARKQAGEYLHLAPGDWRWLSLRSTERFDKWTSEHFSASH